ncbi:protein kinase [Collinsella sp. An2]|uniref:serine/threonine protein kinase n=1 Tax=Collinsella sp. An2 TaxID=1965585 RepID=UPI000B382D65|nr:protein kinase [Collinsella sp. An2]OUP11061.1 hypothetical protein B5F33_01405 [Collinsella sp. An2]
MDDLQVRHAMSIDDAYVVERVLARGERGITELVTLDGAGPFVRKRMPHAAARRMVWAALAECSSPYLPRVQATYDMPDEFVAVYDFVAGETLSDVMNRRGKLSLDEVADIVAAVFNAASDLHAHHVVHADIAPSNIIVAADGAHLIDFDIARMTYDAPASGEQTWGTYGFAAPEQHGFAPIDTRSDIYAIGRLAGYLLVGTLLDERTYEAALRCTGLVPEAVCSVLGRACAFEPSARFQTADALASAFADAVRGEASDMGPEDSSEMPSSISAATSRHAADVAEKPPLSTDDAGRTELSGAETGHASSKSSHMSSATRRMLVGVLAVVVVVLGALGFWMLGGRAQDSGTDAHDDASPVATATDDLSGFSDAPDELGGSALPESSEPASEEAQACLKIVDSGWSVDAAGYINYGVAIQNTSEDLTIEFPAYTITGRSEDGSILYSDTQALSVIYPGETRYFGSIAGNGNAPATVEFATVAPYEWAVSTAAGRPSTFDIAHLSAVSNGIGGTSITGEVTMTSKGNDAEGASNIELTLIARNDSGSIVYGADAFITMPAEGAATPFEIFCYDLPSYSSFEIYAQPW